MLDLFAQRLPGRRRIACRDCARGSGPTRPIGYAEFGVRLGDRPPLVAVGVEDAFAGPALQHTGEFPGQIVHVLDAGIGTEAAGRRESVGGVAGKENPPLPEGLRNLRRAGPECEVDQLHLEIVDADRAPGDLEASLGCEAFRALTARWVK